MDNIHMNQKELVTRAITFQHPPRPPLYFRTDPERSDIVQAAFGAPTRFVDASQTLDEWGCVWGNAIGTGTGYVISHPLEDWSILDSYKFPDPCRPDRYTEIEKFVRAYPDKFVVAAIGLSGFSLMSELRGFENLLVDFYENPGSVERLADQVFDFEMAAIREIGRRGADGVWFFDDWGTERALFIRPAQWRQFFKGRYAAQFRLIHDLGMRACFHSCGCVWQVIPEFIEIGVDVLNLEQMLIFGDESRSGYERIAQEYGDKVCFTVNVDTQRTLDSENPGDVEAEIHHIFQTFNRPEGGFILFADAGKDHNFHPGENLRLAEECFQKGLQEYISRS
jgi:uroporphyrinogen-III decarboxylase